VWNNAKVLLYARYPNPGKFQKKHGNYIKQEIARESVVVDSCTSNSTSKEPWDEQWPNASILALMRTLFHYVKCIESNGGLGSAYNVKLVHYENKGGIEDIDT
jgi:hypothetical protein